jgi:hypothetical protein
MKSRRIMIMENSQFSHQRYQMSHFHRRGMQLVVATR